MVVVVVMPGRVALKLPGEGFCMVRSSRSGENGPLRKAARRPAADRAGRGLGVQTIYSALKRDIVELTLAPGQPLDEMRLSERFAMSRTPIREALVRLAAEGLVT